MSSVQNTSQNQMNLQRSANQIQLIGNQQPPNMSGVSERILQTASPTNLNLVNTTRVSQNASDQAANTCRNYTDINGIRQLQQIQRDRSYYDAGCGWIYKPSNGIHPEINRGALGTHKGPTRDTLPPGSKWFWDLEEAEKEITQKICNNASKCRQLSNLGKYSEVCGYCKQTGAVIPIIRNGNTISARYPNDNSLMCESREIITSGSGSCPAEGFSDFGGSEVPLGKDVPISEGFVSLDDIDSCKPPLTRDCIVLSARLAGCSDKGTLIKSLQSAPPTGPYDSLLKQKMSFNAYQNTANPNITSQILRDGSAGVDAALNDFGRLVQNTTATQEKLKASARDLCLSAGEYNTYDFCKEITNNTIINNDYIKCVQDDWKQNGGTEAGLEYPTLARYNGRSWSQYINIRNEIMKNMKSTNKEINAKAIQQFIGVNTLGELPTTTIMARDETTRGAETVWIDTRDNMNGSFPPTILKCDLKLAKDGPVYPEFRDKQTMASQHNVPEDNIAFTSAFEFRPTGDSLVSYQVTTDDGFMLSMNQNPFENTQYKSNDWGSWRYQGPTTYQSKGYLLTGANKSGTNTVVFKWFHGGGIAAHVLLPKLNNTRILNQATDASARNDMYLTQEPLAPWLQYEICERPNLNQGNRMGFHEKRWNGPAAYTWAGNKPIPSFDVITSGVGINTREKCITFMKNSSWHTASRFAYTAFRTLTLCVRPKPTLANGARGLIFTHTNVGGLDIGFNLMNRNGRYVFSMWNGRQWIEVPAVLNDWNFIVIQYAGDRNGVRNITINANSMTNLKNPQTRSNFLRSLLTNQAAGGGVLAMDATLNKNHAGYLVLGTVAPTMKDINNNPVKAQRESFTGDIKWLHGFRNYLDTERLLSAEIDQRWISRWPRDMPVQNTNSNKQKILIGSEGQDLCVPDNTTVIYEASGASRTKVVSGCFKATNQFFGGDPKWGIRKNVFALL